MATTVTEIRPDEAGLRQARRARVLAEMEAADVDVLVLGREANARYVSGAPRLWTAGSKAFGPGCVLVRETGAVHLLSTWDEGVPEDIPHEHLYGISFNSTTFLEVLKGIDGAATARRVATDGLSHGAARMLPASFPEAEVVDGEALMQRARRIKTPQEVDAIRASVRVAEASLAAAAGALAAGVTERQLTAVFMETMAREGVTTPSTQDVAWISSLSHPWHRSSRDRPAAEGDLVVFEAGILLDGYAGDVGRTRAVGAPSAAAQALAARCDELWAALWEACRPGAPAADLLAVYEKAGLPATPVPVARGLGLGYDLPLVSAELPDTAADQTLEPGMVLALTAHVWEEGVGAVHGQEPVVLTDSGPELLSAQPFRGQPLG